MNSQAIAGIFYVLHVTFLDKLYLFVNVKQ